MLSAILAQLSRCAFIVRLLNSSVRENTQAMQITSMCYITSGKDEADRAHGQMNQLKEETNRI